MSNKNMPETKTEGEDVLKALQAAAKGLLFPSESDKPVKAFEWDGAAGSGAVDVAALKAGGDVPDGASDGSTIETVTLEKFFDPVIAPESWWGDEEKATAKSFQDLIAALKANLTDVTVFRVAGTGADNGDSSLVDAYVVGRMSDGRLAGVQTQLVET